MRNKLTQKQETFCLNIFQGMSQREAYLKAGYSANMALSVIDVKASQLASNGKVMVRIQGLRQKAEDDSVMNVLERKQRLTEISRAKLTDFMELGQDGSWVNIGKETPQCGAIQEIHSRTEYDDDGSKPTVHTSVKLHDPMKAIDLLNKMDKIYSDGYQDNRTVNKTFNILVIDQETKNLISQIPQRLLNNANAHDQSIQGDSGSMGGAEEGDSP